RRRQPREHSPPRTVRPLRRRRPRMLPRAYTANAAVLTRHSRARGALGQPTRRLHARARGALASSQSARDSVGVPEELPVREGAPLLLRERLVEEALRALVRAEEIDDEDHAVGDARPVARARVLFAVGEGAVALEQERQLGVAREDGVLAKRGGEAALRVLHVLAEVDGPPRH